MYSSTSLLMYSCTLYYVPCTPVPVYSVLMYYSSQCTPFRYRHHIYDKHISHFSKTSVPPKIKRKYQTHLQNILFIFIEIAPCRL